MTKLENKKLMVCCANGAGTALMMKMALEKVLAKCSVNPAELRCCSIADGIGVAQEYDVVFCARSFTDRFADAAAQGTTVLGLRNIMSSEEMEEALRGAGFLNG